MRCNHCYREGHNVKTCKKLEDDVKSNLGGYYHRRYEKYFDKEGNRKKDSTTRRCSYCGEPGHTKRTCDTKLNDMIANIKTNAEYRWDMYNFLKDKGLGVGSLVTIANNMFLVTEIKWDKFTCGDNRWNQHHLEFHSVDGNSSHRNFTIDEYIIKYSRDSIQVDVPEHNIPEPSDEWFSGRSEFYEDFQGLIQNPFSFEPRKRF